MMKTVEDIESLPDAGGAYALVIELLRPLTLALKGRPETRLDPGRYLYGGSARGPGGIRARVRRHARVGKTLRWHVDILTNTAGVQAVAALTGGNECDVIGRVAKLPGASIPVPGFGSSDCTDCAAHLIHLPDDADMDAFLTILAGDDGVVWRCPPVVCFLPPGVPGKAD
ncbi:MAG: DUF123 domain-containing protein [Rhodospirillales bacterium]|nr:DUF123 domain-containing protein [Rhodospirillales bacterium]